MRLYRVQYLHEVINKRNGKVSKEMAMTAVELPTAITSLPVEQAYQEAEKYLRERYDCDFVELVDIRPA